MPPTPFPAGKTGQRGICYECGITANVLTCLKRYSAPPLQLAFTVSTYGNGVCIVCKKKKPVTEERDFFYPEVELIAKTVEFLKSLGGRGAKRSPFCFRCGVERKEIKRDKISCYHWGKSYPRHMYKV